MVTMVIHYIQVRSNATTEGRERTNTSARAKARVLFATFLIQKKTGDLRPVLDLRCLNKTISVQSFRMESLQSVAQALTQGDWMLSLDLKDAYLHVSVHPHFHKYFLFAVSDQHFQFGCLPFGLYTSTRTFSKILLSVIAIVHRQGLQAFHYLDDILLVTQSP